MTKYEVMYILRSNLDAEATKAEVEAAKAIFTSNASNVLECKEWGLREFVQRFLRERVSLHHFR